VASGASSPRGKATDELGFRNMANLRIVTRNCGMALARKAPSLLALNPDTAVIQECSEKSLPVLSIHGFSGLWFGANPNKGLAIFCREGVALQAIGKPFGKWVVPVQVSGAVNFGLLGVWACPVGTKRADNYIGEVHRCLAEHRGWFSNASVVAAGDFNSNVRWDANHPGRNHTEVVRLLENHGLISADHARHQEKQGAETRPTYHFYRHQDKPFHIDYVFVPKDWKLGSVEVGSFREWGHLSDHVPVAVDVSIGGSA
jgi:exodeoxyribonuclease-3